MEDWYSRELDGLYKAKRLELHTIKLNHSMLVMACPSPFEGFACVSKELNEGADPAPKNVL